MDKEEKVEKEEKKVEKEEFYDEKKDKKSLFSRIMNVVLWVVLFAWMGLCLIDFFNTKTNKSPMFCLKKDTTTYSDGTVTTCLGVGYKVFNYDRDSYRGREFNWFWAKDRSAEATDTNSNTTK